MSKNGDSELASSGSLRGEFASQKLVRYAAVFSEYAKHSHTTTGSRCW